MRLLIVFMLALAVGLPLRAEEHRTVIVVQGTPGAAEYGPMFSAWSDRWVQAAKSGKATAIRIGAAQPDAGAPDIEQLKTHIEQFAAQTIDKPEAELWIVLVGHGTFDGRTARFNLRGIDVSEKQLATWIAPIKHRTVIIDCAASSAPFLKELSAPNRVVVTATKSGAELNFSRFGDYLSKSIGDINADLDKDGQTSLFEAYLAASRETENFYKTEGRLATEHAILDDNGDGQGVRSDWFLGIRSTKKADQAKVDGRFAHQLHLIRSDREQALEPATRTKRNQLELAVIQLRNRRDDFQDLDLYYDELQPLLIELARLYESVEKR